MKAANPGEILRNHRLARQLSLQEVAQKVGATRQAVGKWEAGTAQPATHRLGALFDCLRLTNAQRRELVAAFGGSDGNA